MAFEGMSIGELEGYIQCLKIRLKTVERELSDQIHAKGACNRLDLKREEQSLLEELRVADICLNDKQMHGK